MKSANANETVEKLKRPGIRYRVNFWPCVARAEFELLGVLCIVKVVRHPSGQLRVEGMRAIGKRLTPEQLNPLTLADIEKDILDSYAYIEQMIRTEVKRRRLAENGLRVSPQL